MLAQFREPVCSLKRITAKIIIEILQTRNAINKMCCTISLLAHSSSVLLIVMEEVQFT